jgi:hypothetical protein
MFERERFGLGDRATPPPDDDPRYEDSLGSLLLRGASVVPFMMLGVMAVISIVAWVVVFMFGVGAGQAIWDWLPGRSPWEVVSQVGLALLVGLVPVAILVLSMMATSYGVRRHQAGWFWPLTQVLFTAVAVALFVLDQTMPQGLESVGIDGRDWWLIFGYAAYAVLMAGLRIRAAARAESGGGAA